MKNMDAITELDELAEINEVATERYLREQARQQRQREHNQKWKADCQARAKEAASRPKAVQEQPRKKRIKPVSRKNAMRAKDYGATRTGYLTRNPVCHCCIERGREPKPATQIHHIVGRDGDRLCDSRLWMAVCEECHTTGTEAIHVRPAVSYSKGWMLSRFWDRDKQVEETRKLRGHWPHVKSEVERAE